MNKSPTAKGKIAASKIPKKVESEPEDMPEKSETGTGQINKGENVSVVVRIRPMNEAESSRGDSTCLLAEDQATLSINSKSGQKSYQFNAVLPPGQTQQKAYQRCNVTRLIDAAIDGYSATVFAYGQTGSGKTYTMSGNEEIFSRETYKTDQREGIIPRAIQELWRKIKDRKNECVIKASYTEIYNEQIKDLLNLSSGVLHCRWNPSNGFFVQDLIVVDCSNVDDMISVLHEGIKNRRSGSHDLNKDSSRSHSILTLYIISESTHGSQSAKKYGKISFVDLAGSERLKESKSQGEMIKETGSINKSLFTLGKVIKGLTDKKSKTPYIPYRDSKLTMLLMDSLGGNSKALMIACTCPSGLYYDETLSTLNYAARTMNIRNKPMIQMDQKDQAIQEIQSEIQELRRINLYLREQYQRVGKGLPLKIPQMNSMVRTASQAPSNHSNQLPPLDKDRASHTPSLGTPLRHNSTDRIISDYQLRFEQIKKENEIMRRQKEESEMSYQKLMETNSVIENKLQNLEQIFLSKKKEPNENEVISSGLLVENTELKKRLRELEKQKVDTWVDKEKGKTPNQLGLLLRNENELLQKEIEAMQARESDLMTQLQRKH